MQRSKPVYVGNAWVIKLLKKKINTQSQAALIDAYIMRNAALDEAQAGIKTAGRNVNNLRYAMTPQLWQKTKN